MEQLDLDANNEPLPVRWVGELDRSSPTLGLAVLEGTAVGELYRATPENGTYSHHGYITLHDGALVAAWSNHRCDEDGPGQRVLMARSDDDGGAWLGPRELFPPQDALKPGAEQDDEHDRVLIANGFAVTDDTLYGIAEVHVLADRRGLGRLARAIHPGGDLGPIFWLRADPPSPVSGFPAYPSAADREFASRAAAIRAWLNRPDHWPSWEFVHQLSRPKAADGHQLCEPSEAWRVKGAYVRLYRDLGRPPSGCNYVQTSFDGGASWTAPVRTTFPDACSRSAAGTLPDGTAYVVNNPGRSRDPLVISLASDGLTFDRHAVLACGAPERRYDGRWKDRGFEYPHAVVGGDSLYVIYSINKEDMAAARIPLRVLSDLGVEGA